MFNSVTVLLALSLALVLFAPRFGLVARWCQMRQLTARCRREDVLKHILKCEVNGQTPTLDSIAGILRLKSVVVTRVLQEMEQRGLVSHEGGRLGLKAAGRELALHVVRAHRLWESYLAEQTGVAEAEWHHQAEYQEHLLSPQQANALSAQLGHPTRDPHGDLIPQAGEELPADRGQALNAVAQDAPALIAHIEDEPETVYAQLSAQGLRPGMKVCVLEKTPERIRFWADGKEHLLAPVLANNIAVVPLPEFDAKDLFEEEYLADLNRGERAKVLHLSPACRGAERRRLLDLGFVNGTMVEVEMVSPGGDPTAYRVRGTVVALRREQAGLIRIVREEAVPA